jgi:hypothetical protein
MPVDLRNFIVEQIEAEPHDVVMISGMLGLAQLSQLIPPTDRPEVQALRAALPGAYPRSTAATSSPRSREGHLVHHPFESFDVVVNFLRQAATDPSVIAIKQTLYRTSKDSPIVAALIEAAENGKNVTALVEIKARFDEEANLKWARDLERAGVHVVFGFVEYKTHAKISIVVRREGEGLSTYCHFGTGNYHPVTARVYTDLSLFTNDPRLGRDASRVFNFITGYAVPDSMEKLAFSPITLKNRLIPAHRAGGGERPGRQARRHLGQAERARGPGGHRRALPGQPGRRPRRAHRARRVLPPPRRARPVGEHPRQVDRGPLPRTQPHRGLRQRGRHAGATLPGLHFPPPTGCPAIWIAASRPWCPSSTPPCTVRCWTRSWWPI